MTAVRFLGPQAGLGGRAPSPSPAPTGVIARPTLYSIEISSTEISP